jgi:hypothetical protein
MAKGGWAYIQFVERPGGRPGRPTDPDYGIDEGGYPDQGLPGGRPPHVGNRPPGSWEPPVHPGQGLPWPGRPVDPDWGWGGSERPDQGLPGGWGRPPRPDQGLPRPPTPPSVWPKPPGGGLPVDPSWGVPGGEHPSHGLPIYPMDPEHPDNVLPEVPGVEPPPVDPPPGTIWPPLPPEIPAGQAIAVVGITGVGWRYAVITVPVHPDQGLPAEPAVPEPQPPVAQPKRGGGAA